MDQTDINEACEALGYGDRAPERLSEIIMEFQRRKNVVLPSRIDPGEFAFCTMLYDMETRAAQKDKKEELPKDGGKED